MAKYSKKKKKKAGLSVSLSCHLLQFTCNKKILHIEFLEILFWFHVKKSQNAKLQVKMPKLSKV